MASWSIWQCMAIGNNDHAISSQRRITLIRLNRIELKPCERTVIGRQGHNILWSSGVPGRPVGRAVIDKNYNIITVLSSKLLTKPIIGAGLEAEASGGYSTTPNHRPIASQHGKQVSSITLSVKKNCRQVSRVVLSPDSLIALSPDSHIASWCYRVLSLIASCPHGLMSSLRLSL
jgi:hypothetical protein